MSELLVLRSFSLFLRFIFMASLKLSSRKAGVTRQESGLLGTGDGEMPRFKDF